MSQEIIKKEENNKIEKAQALAIITPEDMTSATSLLSELNKANDRITAEKEKITKPLNEALKVERARWKPAELLLEEAIKTVRAKMSGYQTLALAEQREEEAKIASRIGEGKGKLKVETAMNKMANVDKPEDKVQTDAGSVSFREKKCFEVIDMSLLPIKYHLADEIAIRKQMQADIELPGCRYWTEQSIINKR